MASVHSNASSDSSAKPTINDPMSPYFLYHSDGPGLVLVSQPFIGDNYAS